MNYLVVTLSKEDSISYGFDETNYNHNIAQLHKEALKQIVIFANANQIENKFNTSTTGKILRSEFPAYDFIEECTGAFSVFTYEGYFIGFVGVEL